MLRRTLALTALTLTAILPLTAQQAGTPQPAQQAQPAQPAQGGRGRGGAPQPFDEARARQLYVSNRFEDHAKPNFENAVKAKAAEDAKKKK